MGRDPQSVNLNGRQPFADQPLGQLSKPDRRLQILSILRIRPPSLPGPAALLIAMVIALIAPGLLASSIPEGVWLIEKKAAVQIFGCNGLLCGRILWLQSPRDLEGELSRDKKNRNPALRQRRLCGLTMLWDLRASGPDRWEGGRFYNPEDGKTYNVSAHLKSADMLVARIYLGMPAFGKTKVLHRVTHGISDGWC
jgi:uncharacterized protein (DUF2147 family)